MASPRSRKSTPPVRPSWAAPVTRQPLTRTWVVLLILTTLIVGVTRLAALPRSIWHQDEAVFASSVLNFSIEWGRPHPPWFPLWIALGKGLHATGIPAARSLQLLSATFSTLSVVPLFLLWSLWLRRELALAAALLYLFLPGVWMLSGRAFSDTPALTLLVAALALILNPNANRRMTALGSLFAGLTILIRPQHLILLAGPLVVAWYRKADRRSLVLPLTACLGAGAAGLLIFGGTPRLLWRAFRLQAAYANSHGITAEHALSQLGPARALLLPSLGALRAVLAALGAVLLWRARLPARGALLLATCLPSVALVFFLVDGTITRYWLPTLALGCGLAVIAISRIGVRGSLVLISAAIAASAWVIVPRLASLRRATSPPIEALETAERRTISHRWNIVADFNLFPFAEYLRLTGHFSQPIVYDVELGRTQGIPPPWQSLAIYTDHQDRFILSGGTPRVFPCRVPFLPRIEPSPYDTVTIVPAATVHHARRRLPSR